MKILSSLWILLGTGVAGNALEQLDILSALSEGYRNRRYILSSADGRLGTEGFDALISSAMGTLPLVRGDVELKLLRLNHSVLHHKTYSKEKGRDKLEDVLEDWLDVFLKPRPEDWNTEFYIMRLRLLRALAPAICSMIFPDQYFDPRSGKCEKVYADTASLAKDPDKRESLLFGLARKTSPFLPNLQETSDRIEL